MWSLLCDSLLGLCDELHQRLRASEQARETAERKLLTEVL